MGKKNKIIGGDGKEIFSSLENKIQAQALEVAGEVMQGIFSAQSAFSGDGSVGQRLSAVAPGIVGNPKAIVPKSDDGFGKGQLVKGKLQLVYAFLNPGFVDALSDFQLKMARGDIHEQAKMVKNFSEIDWKFLASSSKPEGILAKIQTTLYLRTQNGKVQQADLKSIVALTQVPQFVDLLSLATAYGKIMDAAYTSYMADCSFLERQGGDYVEIAKKLQEILVAFENAETERLASLQGIKETGEFLQKALDIATVLANVTNRSSEMRTRVELETKLIDFMNTNTTQTDSAQIALLEEMSNGLFLLASNSVRESRMVRLANSLGLYIRAYTVFVLIIAMAQVYLNTGAAAIQKLLGDYIYAAGKDAGITFYRESVEPFQKVINGCINRFGDVTIPSTAEVPAVVES